MIKKSNYLCTLMILSALMLIFNACKDNSDDPQISGNAPVISLTDSEKSGQPGNNVTTAVTINAVKGLKKLNIYKNGTLLDELPYSFEKTISYNFTYQIDEGSPEGTVINIAFEAIDSLDQKSAQKSFKITVLAASVKETIQVTSDITSNTTWTANKFWRINDIIKVADGAILTIEPGTVVLGASDTKGTLLIQRGAKIIADGTATQPIIFTSDKAPGSRAAGDWSGIVICGKAPNNQGNSIILEGDYGAAHGGTVADDNSGILRYVRIEFAGKVIGDNKEINSLTLASVGSATVIENIQCSYGLDDSFEFFGGTVNAKRLISYKTIDDDFDFDFGYVGLIQYGYAIRDANLADRFTSNGIEVDNDGAGTPKTPLTHPILANITIIGGKYAADINQSLLLQNAAHIRKNSAPCLYNSFMTGFPVGIFVDDTKPGVSQNALDNKLQVRNVILAGVENWGNNGWGGPNGTLNIPLKQIDNSIAPGFEVNAWYNTASYQNQILNKWQDAGIDQSIYTSTSPKNTPNSGSLLLTSAHWDNAPAANVNFFDKVNFIGAFGSQDWASGWCSWDPQNEVYQ